MTDDEIAWLRSEFERCSGWIQDALDRDIGTHSIEDVKSLIEDGAAQLWPLPHSAIVTTIEDYPQAKVLRGWLAGGDLIEIIDAEVRIRRWAKDHGCDMVLLGGRRGWVRVFPGYTEAHTIVVRRL